MKTMIALLVTVSVLSACGRTYHDDAGPQGPQGMQGAQGPAGPAAPAPTPTAVENLVAMENSYRNSVGQESLIKGLSCTLYTVPTTTTQIVGATGLVTIGSFQYLDQFNQANSSVNSGLMVLPPALRSVIQTWFIVKCSGQLVVSDDAWHSFNLISDDGANLYIDGLLINNDGLHGVQSVSNVKYLKYGFHSFELDFFQGAGQQALILNQDGGLMSATNFYH